MSAREAVLQRIRTALQRPTPTPQQLDAEWHLLPRAYAAPSRLSNAGRLTLLEDRLRDYDAETRRVHESDVAMAIDEQLAARGSRPTVVPEGFPAAWMPSSAALVVDRNFSAVELDRFDGVVTGSSLAIAQTGSLVLQNVPGQGRRALSLVPDFMLCVVRQQDIVESVPEAFARLAASLTLPTTFVSGPSATADIEMTRIKGVHGPRFLSVLLVESGEQSAV